MAEKDDLKLNRKYWRNRAKQARTMASEMTDKTAQEALQQVARGYDRLADKSKRANETATRKRPE